MRLSSVGPVNLPREFKIDEMFFSTTDAKGIIRSGNDVFARVSGYTMTELVGQPHNIIRHPDMPRVVFRLLWATLHQAQPIAALVKNMAKDGRYYWVVALITPVPGGYLSVRFKPSSPISTALEAIYVRLRAIEARHGDGGAEGRAGMDEAEQALGEELGKLGFADYAGFMWKFLHEELKSRDAQTGGIRVSAPGERAGGSGRVELLRSIHQGAAQAYARINTLYQRLDELTALHDRLAGKTAAVFEHTLNIRFVALSTTIKAAQLGEVGRSLGVLAQYLGDASSRTSAEVLRLTGHIKDISSELHTVIFNLAGARLQLEMMLYFAGELLQAELAGETRAKEKPGASQQDMIGGLQQAFHATMVKAVGFLSTLGKHLTGLDLAAEELSRTFLTLHVAQVGGKVEASRLHDDDSIMALLTDIHGRIQGTAGELTELGDISGQFATLIRSVPAVAEAIDQWVDRIDRDVQQLSGATAEIAASATPAAAHTVEAAPARVRPRPKADTHPVCV